MNLSAKRSFRRLLSTSLLIIGLSSASLTLNAQEAVCTALSDWDGGPDDLEITLTGYLGPDDAANLSNSGSTFAPPPLCHIEGSFESRVGRDGSDYAIRFMIEMPDEWNGSFLFQGGIATNGNVRPGHLPLLGGAGTETALERGFAYASTDSGHRSGEGDAWMDDQQAMLNFLVQANAKVTEVVRPIIEHYYGSGIDHSYFIGFSTGGREGMILAQRFPYLFDGIISGDPAIRTGVSELAQSWIEAELAKADPFTPEEAILIKNALLDRCDALDGQSDGLIFNHSACDFDPRQIACSASSAEECLADNKAEALARALAGPVTTGGEALYVPFPYDSGIEEQMFSQYGGGWARGDRPGGNSAETLDVDAEYVGAVAVMDGDLEESLGDTGTHYNVSSFIANGGKHIYYHGVSDSLFSANDLIRYFEEMATSNADVMPISDYARLYLVPGMTHGHSGGPDSFDFLTPLVEWVESGTHSNSVVATGESMPGESRPLCPYPEYAHYVGGDPSLAASYACRND